MLRALHAFRFPRDALILSSSGPVVTEEMIHFLERITAEAKSRMRRCSAGERDSGRSIQRWVWAWNNSSEALRGQKRLRAATHAGAHSLIDLLPREQSSNGLFFKTDPVFMSRGEIKPRQRIFSSCCCKFLKLTQRPMTKISFSFCVCMCVWKSLCRHPFLLSTMRV